MTSADRFSVWGVVYASTSSTANPGTKRSGGRGGTAGLLVAVDQRTAALRDRLSDGRRGPTRLRDARPAGPPPQPAPEPERVQRRVSSRGSIAVAHQRITVGVAHAGATFDVEAADTTVCVYDGDQLITEVPRTTTKPIARFKVRKPEPPRQRRHTGDVPANEHE